MAVLTTTTYGGGGLTSSLGSELLTRSLAYNEKNTLSIESWKRLQWVADNAPPVDLRAVC